MVETLFETLKLSVWNFSSLLINNVKIFVVFCFNFLDEIFFILLV